MIESIPELRTAYFDAVERALEPHPRYSVWREVERADQVLQSALWRQAVESHRWVREYDQLVTDYGEVFVWKLLRDCQVAYWVVSRGRTRHTPGWGDGAQLALRDGGMVDSVRFAMFTHRCWSVGYLTAHVYPIGKGAPGDRCVCGEVTAGDEFEDDEW